MPISGFLSLTGRAKPITSEEGRRILERDRYRCQYCGLDGMSNFENSLIMTVDFIQPRARKGKKSADNLVTACRPCNVIKGRRVFRDFEHAKAYVLNCRNEMHKDWEAKMARLPKATAGAAT